MSAMRTPLSIAAVVLASLALGGCYDLSDPSGPHRDDFVNEISGTQQQPEQPTKAEAEVRCEQTPCDLRADTPAVQVLEATDANGAAQADDRRKLRIVLDDR